MKLLIIGSPQVKESQLLKQEAIKRNHLAEIIPLSKLVFGGKKILSIITLKGIDIKNFDAVLFRAINRHTIEAEIVAQYMKNGKKTVIDEILSKGNYRFHKFFMHSRLWAKNIPQPPTFYAINSNGIKQITQIIKPPFIVKHLKEMHGRNTFRFNSEKEVIDFLKAPGKKRQGNFLIQEWYPSKYYYRTIVLGDKVLGVIKRLSLFCKSRPEIPLNQRSEKTNLSADLENLSLKSAKAVGIELAGIDIMPDKEGNLRILEINRSPKFRRFTKVTGINAAEEIIKYIEGKRAALLKS